MVLPMVRNSRQDARDEENVSREGDEMQGVPSDLCLAPV